MMVMTPEPLAPSSQKFNSVYGEIFESTDDSL